MTIHAALRRSFSASHSLDRLAAGIGLGIPPALRPELVAQFQRRAAGTIGGVAVGVVLAFGFGTGAGLPTLTRLLLYLVCCSVGVAVGSGMAAALNSMRHLGDGPRVARTEDVGLTDYLAPTELTLIRSLTALATAVGVLFGLCLVLGISRPLHPLGWQLPVGMAAALALPLLALVVFEVLARRIVDSPQPAADEYELAWSDAMRTQHLRDLSQLPVGLSLGAVLAVASQVVDGPFVVTDGAGQWLFWAVPLLSLLAVALMVAGYVLVEARAPQRRFLDRLWAGGTRLQTGRPPAPSTGPVH